jgi:hypothetical protein
MQSRCHWFKYKGLHRGNEVAALIGDLIYSYSPEFWDDWLTSPSFCIGANERVYITKALSVGFPGWENAISTRF